MSLRYAFLALVTLPLAACDGVSLRGDGQPDVAAHSGPPAISPLEVPIETGTGTARQVATADAATMNTAAFSARGNEPFWAVDVAGRTALYKTPQNQKGRAVRVKRLTFAEGVEYVGSYAGRPFALTVRSGRCQDSMSGERFSMTAMLKVSGRSMQGCAGPASAEVANAVAAIKAPAPVMPKARAATPKPPVDRPTPAPAPEAQPAVVETPAPAAPAIAPPVVDLPEVENTVPTPAMELPATPPVVTPSAPAPEAQ